MVNINVNFQKKDLWLLSAIVVFLVGVGFVVAYGGNNPAVMGHSCNEIEGGCVNANSGFNPSNYAGEESVTFPNGMIMKMGVIINADSPAIVTFTDAFPTAGVQAYAIPGGDVSQTYVSVYSISASGLKIRNNGVIQDVRWFAIGY